VALQDVGRRCKELGATAVEIVTLDVLDFASHGAVADRVIAKLGRVDVLVRTAAAVVAARSCRLCCCSCCCSCCSCPHARSRPCYCWRAQVNNAGRSQRGLFEDTEMQVEEDVLRLNVLGPVSVRARCDWV
jgi:NAD(P)-dependent dehydrogenase (short-subunit alcohol dehydrogenase family)